MRLCASHVTGLPVSGARVLVAVERGYCLCSSWGLAGRPPPIWCLGNSAGGGFLLCPRRKAGFIPSAAARSPPVPPCETELCRRVLLPTWSHVSRRVPCFLTVGATWNQQAQLTLEVANGRLHLRSRCTCKCSDDARESFAHHCGHCGSVREAV